MNIFLTGGTGYIGSSVLDHLVRGGHHVTALVRSEESAAKVSAAGATALHGDITDITWLTGEIAKSDGAIHTASPGDATSEAVDRGVVQAAVQAFGSTTKPFLYTSGIWIYGNASTITEHTPVAPPALTAWRPSVEALISGSDLTWSIIVPAVVYGHGKGIPALLPAAPRTESGALPAIGDGHQHWTAVHVDDLGSLYVTVLDQGFGSGYVIGAGPENPTVLELTTAAAHGAEVVPEGADASRERLGAYFADALMLDQQAVATKAHSLGWRPKGPSLLEDLATGSYTHD
ncbi:NAD-dependent epimerase/dehydratase family protein [Nakamurella silvestris]|nr:NAD-dependent epimerase/dehydratase family protein [Nakamurella silvestris]